MKTWHINSYQLPRSFKVEQVGFNLYANGMSLRTGGGSGFSTNTSMSLQVDEKNLFEVENAYKAEGIAYEKVKSLFYSA